MSVRQTGKAAAVCLVVAALASPAFAQKKDGIEKCDAPIGTISINEP